jgi:nitrogen fixation/metabolism regulation signal transduction histidine kinase
VTRRGRRRLSHDQRVFALALLAGLPALAVALALVADADWSGRARWTLALVLVVAWWSTGTAARNAVVRPLQTLSNLLAALREEDFSFRARGTGGDDPLSQVMWEVNALADTLRSQRLGALEASALLRKVMEEIDVAVFAFDGEQRLRLVNRAGERVLARPAERLLGRAADELGLAAALDGEAPRVEEIQFPGGAGRFEIRRASFRQGGLPHPLLVLADVSRALREEEQQAWKRLIRVLGHELNNSLAPIRSIAGSLESLLARRERAPDWEEDARRGIAVIQTRAAALSRFMEGYARLARLPAPQLETLAVGPLVARVARLETRVAVAVEPGPELRLQADSDQLEQLLINLLRNAADAVRETGGSVSVGWRRARGQPPRLELWVDDEGPGLPASATNLFVPFFTTKPGGSGIGLALCRQIAEAHGGELTLENRRGGHGCRARLRLPL